MAQTSIAGEVSLPDLNDWKYYYEKNKNYFRRHISDWTSINFIFFLCITNSCDAKVNYFNLCVSLCFEENIFKFQISVDDASDVAVMNSAYYLLNNFACFKLIDTTFLFDPFVQFTATSALHDHD